MIPAGHKIGVAQPDQLSLLGAIELACAACFPPEILPPERRNDTVSMDTLVTAQRQGLLWVATEPTGEVVGYLVAQVLGPELYVAQLDVHPEYQRRGLGRALVQHSAQAARNLGLRTVTLTTFDSVPWNGPWYRKLGFVKLRPDQWTPHLEAQLASEIHAGLSDRIAMRLVV